MAISLHHSKQLPLNKEQQSLRLLTEEDWEIWKKLRLESLQVSPESFRVLYEEEKDKSEADWRRMLRENDILGYFQQQQLIGCVGFYTYYYKSVHHKGAFFGTYVTPQYRRQGIAKTLMEALLQHAKKHVLQLNCSVVTTNEAAYHLYLKYGFVIYGKETRASKINDIFYDEYLLSLKFD